MRKYFLLAATALLAASTANAAGNTNTATLGADAKLQFAATYNCTNLTFGTITLNSGADLTNVTIEIPANGGDPVYDDTKVASVSDDAKAGDCSSAGVNSNDWFNDPAVQMPGTLTLNNDEGGTSASVTLDKQGYKIGGTVTFAIPDNSLTNLTKWAGDYAGTVQIIHTY